MLTQGSLPIDDEIVWRLFGDDVRAGLTSHPMDITDAWKNSYSENTTHKVWAAKYTARHPNLVALELSSFKCGHDAPIYTVVEEIVSKSGTPYFSFKDIDENKPTGSIRIRVETISYFLKRYREDMVARKKKQSEIDIKLAEFEARMRAEFAGGATLSSEMTTSQPKCLRRCPRIWHTRLRLAAMSPGIQSEKVMFQIYREPAFNRRYRVVYFTELDEHNKESEINDALRGESIFDGYLRNYTKEEAKRVVADILARLNNGEPSRRRNRRSAEAVHGVTRPAGARALASSERGKMPTSLSTRRRIRFWDTRAARMADDRARPGLVRPPDSGAHHPHPALQSLLHLLQRV